MVLALPCFDIELAIARAEPPAVHAGWPIHRQRAFGQHNKCMSPAGGDQAGDIRARRGSSHVAFHVHGAPGSTPAANAEPRRGQFSARAHTGQEGCGGFAGQWCIGSFGRWGGLGFGPWIARRVVPFFTSGAAPGRWHPDGGLLLVRLAAGVCDLAAPRSLTSGTLHWNPASGSWQSERFAAFWLAMIHLFERL